MWEWAGAGRGGTAGISLVTSSNVALLVGWPEEWPSELLGHQLGLVIWTALFRGRRCLRSVKGWV